MSALEKKEQEASSKAKQSQQSGISGPFPLPNNPSAEAKIFDLEGVTCEPAMQPLHSSSGQQSPTSEESLDQQTLWTFHCDGASYPARLISLPCPVELHKTHDHAMYYKCVDVNQMLLVYEDMTAMEEAESMPGYKPGYKNERYSTYYHSGLTRPMNKVVQRRFNNREHSGVPPPMGEVMEVEKELISLIEKISTKDPNKRPARGSIAAQKSMQTKVLEEIEDEMVDYEPWMDDYGKVPKGIQFDEDDPICKQHPEVWLDSSECKMPAMVEEASITSVSTSGTSVREKKKKKSSTASGSKGEKKTKKKKKKKDAGKKEAAIEISPVNPNPPPEDSRPSSTTSALDVDASCLDNIDFNLEDLADCDEFDNNVIFGLE